MFCVALAAENYGRPGVVSLDWRINGNYRKAEILQPFIYYSHHQKIKVMVVVLEVVALLVVLIAPLAPARKAAK